MRNLEIEHVPQKNKSRAFLKLLSVVLLVPAIACPSLAGIVAGITFAPDQDHRFGNKGTPGISARLIKETDNNGDMGYGANIIFTDQSLTPSGIIFTADEELIRLNVGNDWHDINTILYLGPPEYFVGTTWGDTSCSTWIQFSPLTMSRTCFQVP